MLKVKQGKLTNEYFSFALPERFNFVTDEKIMETENLSFVSDDGEAEIVIVFERSVNDAQEEFKDFCESCGFEARSGFLAVQRGNGTAVGLYYGNGTEEYYEEIYDYDCKERNNRFSVYIKAKNGNGIFNTMALPYVKEFWNNIEYFV